MGIAYICDFYTHSYIEDEANVALESIFLLLTNPRFFGVLPLSSRVIDRGRERMR